MFELGAVGVMMPEMEFDEQVALCRELGVRFYQYRPRVIPPERRNEPYSNWGNHKFDLTPERFLKEGKALTAKLRAAGMEPWGTLPVADISMPDDVLRLHLEGAAAAEAGRIRCQPTLYPKTVFDYESYLKQTVARFREIIERLSRPLGIKLILETHCGTSIASPGLALNLCKHFDPKDLGVICDIANFHREGGITPHLAISVLKDYIDCIHIGGSRYVPKERDEFGCQLFAPEFCAMEDSHLHLPTWLRAIKEARCEAPLIIEDYGVGVHGRERLRRSATFLKKLAAAI